MLFPHSHLCFSMCIHLPTGCVAGLLVSCSGIYTVTLILFVFINPLILGFRNSHPACTSCTEIELMRMKLLVIGLMGIHLLLVNVVIFKYYNIQSIFDIHILHG